MAKVSEMSTTNHRICYALAFVSLAMAAAVLAQGDHMGPADIVIERVEECENVDNYPIKMPVSMKKVNRSHAGFSGCVDLPNDLDEKSMINLTAAKWGDGGWKPNALNYVQNDICKVLKTNTEKPWDAVMRAAGREDGSCPVPKGTYCVENLALELEGLFPKMLYGKFRVDVEVWYAGEVMSCIRAFINSDPSKGKAG